MATPASPARSARRSSEAGRRASPSTTSPTSPPPTPGTGSCSPAAARAPSPPPSPPTGRGPRPGRSPTSSPSSAHGNVAVELWDHGDPLDSARNDALAEIAARQGVDVVATNNAHYASPAQRPLATALAAVRARRSLDELDGWLPAAGTAHLRAGVEQDRRFRRYPGAVERAAELGLECAFDLRLVAPNLPPFPCPDGLTEMQYLRRLTEEGAARRYGPRGSERVAGAYAQIDHELDLIETLGFPGYFLVVWDIVDFCRRAGIYCQGRGSAANSAVCYALGITNADAVSLGLLFERFLSPERDGPPDIDLDIESVRREEAIQYVYAKHGRERAAQVANVITYRAKSSVRDMAKALGYSTGQQDAWSKQVDAWGPVRCDGEAARRDASPSPVLDLALQVEHFPRHLGVHSGGMVICDRPVVEVCPVEWARFTGRNGSGTEPIRTVLQWDKDDCAAVGLVKFDLLGLGMLTAVHAAVDLVRDAHGDEIDLATIPQDDAVYEMLCAGRLGRRVPGRVPRPDGDAAPAEAPLLLRPRRRDRPDPARPDPGRVGAPLHPPAQRRGARHLPPPPHRGGAGEDPRRAAVPGAADAARHRRRRVHGRGVRPAPPGHGLQAVRRADGAPAPALRRGRRRPGGRRRDDRGALGEARRLRQLRLPREPLGVLRLPRLRLVVAEAVVPGGVLRRVAQRPADGLLLAALARAGRPPPRRDDPKSRPQRLGGEGDPRDRHRPGPGATAAGGARDLGRAAGRRCASASGRCAASARSSPRRSPPAGPTPRWRTCAAGCRRSPSPTSRPWRPPVRSKACFGAERREALWQAGAVAQSSPDRLAGIVTGADAPCLPGMDAREEAVADLWATGVSAEGHPTRFLREQLTRLGVVTATGLRAAHVGERVVVAGVVTHRQRPATAGGTTFVNLEDETGFVNVVVSKGCWARYRQAARSAPGAPRAGQGRARGRGDQRHRRALEPLPLDAPIEPRLPLTPMSGERIEHGDAGTGDVGDVPGHQDQVVDEGGHGEQPVHRRDRVGHVQPAPPVGDLRGDGEESVGERSPSRAANNRGPRLRLRHAPTPSLDSLANLADDEHAEVQVGTRRLVNHRRTASGPGLRISETTFVSRRKPTATRSEVDRPGPVAWRRVERRHSQEGDLNASPSPETAVTLDVDDDRDRAGHA